MNSLRRLFALLVSLIMLTSTLPASAYLCSHTWRETTITPATCTEPGLKASVCTQCGAWKDGAGTAIPPLGHSWGDWHWIFGVPTCGEAGSQLRECKRCGYQEDRDRIATHYWSEWEIVKEPTCTEPGRQERNCRRCGITETEDIPSGGHSFTNWRFLTAATCTEKGSEWRECQYCKLYEELEVPPVGHDFSPWTIIKYPSGGEPGIKECVCLRCGLTLQEPFWGEEIDPNAPVDYPPAPAGAGMQISWTVLNPPANGEYFTAGEMVCYMATLTNTSDVTLNSLTVGVSNTEAKIPSVSAIAPGQTIHCYHNHMVRDADTQQGGITCYAYASAATADGPQQGAGVHCQSDPVFVRCYDEDDLPAVFYFGKVVRNAPANGQYFVPGETIEYAVTYTNNCAYEVNDLEISDPLAGVTGDPVLVREPALAAHTAIAAYIRYTVTEADAACGYVTNTASAHWYNPLVKEHFSTSSNTVVTPCGSAALPAPSLTDVLSLTKTILSIPANGMYFVPGEVISYSITAVNTSQIPLHDVRITDPALDGPLSGESALAPGASMTVCGDHTVTDFDAESGSVINIACITAQDETGLQYTEHSNTVQAACGFPDGPLGTFDSLAVVKREEPLPLNGLYYEVGEEIHYAIIYQNDGELPLTDVEIIDVLDNSQPIASAEMLAPGESRTCYFRYTVTAGDAARGYVANSAFYRYAAADSGRSGTSNVVYSPTCPDPVYPQEDAGSVNLSQLQTNDHCRRTLVSWNSNSAAYESSFCSRHAMTQSALQIMTGAAADPVSRQMAYDYAIALWQADLEAMYQQYSAACDTVARSNLVTEYLLFRSWMDNRKAILTSIYPDRPEEVSRILSQLWQDKVISLCCEMSSAPAPRADSFFAVPPSAGSTDAAARCATLTGSQTNSSAQYTDVCCAAHTFLFSMTSPLLGGLNSADAWERLDTMWRAEMGKCYTALQQKLGAGHTALLTAEHSTMEKWLAFRELQLRALYPDNPEIVAEIMTRTIMEHTADLCQLCD